MSLDEVRAALQVLRPARDRLVAIRAELDQLHAEQAELAVWIGDRVVVIERLLEAAKLELGQE